jgi:RNA polymerase sigma-70 factor, ECF subfamily
MMRASARLVEPLETRIREETAEFVRRIGTLSDDPNRRPEVLEQTLRQLAGGLLDAFGDHYALAVQFQLLSELAWRGPDALRAAQGSVAPASGPLRCSGLRAPLVEGRARTATVARNPWRTAIMEPVLRAMEAEIPRLRRYARYLSRDRDKADDLVQNCLTNAIHNLHRWRPGSNLRAWLFTILRNDHWDEIRRRRRAPLVDTGDDLPEVAVSPAYEAHIQLRELHQAFRTLSAEHREILCLVVIEDYTYEAAAGILGIPLGTVRSRLSRARALLRSRIDQRGGGKPRDPARTGAIGEPDRRTEGGARICA